MKLLSLVVLTAAAGVIACNEVVTSPETSADLSPRLGVSNPPPPDVDTSAAVVADGQVQVFQVRYFFNKTANAGWLKFDSEPGDVTVDKNAQIRYSNGVFSGKGIILVNGVAVDLAGVTQASRFGSCPSPVTGDEVTATVEEEAPPYPGCFAVTIEDTAGNDLAYITECTSNRTTNWCSRSDDTPR